MSREGDSLRRCGLDRFQSATRHEANLLVAYIGSSTKDFGARVLVVVPSAALKASLNQAGGATVILHAGASDKARRC